MSESFLNGRVTLHAGDCREVIRGLADASIDSIVTDPPYALVSIGKRFGKPGAAAAQAGASGAYARASAGFMGQQWDTGETAFAVEFWAQALRVLKPGGHVIASSGTRSYHRLACAIEDAGFEIRDQLGWIYGSGFPKSHDVAKGIQKRRLEDVEPVRVICRAIRSAMDAQGLKSRHLTAAFGDCHPRLIDHWAARDSDSQPALPTWEQWLALKAILNLSDALDGEVWRLNGRKGEPGSAWLEAEIIGEREGQTPGLVGKRFSDADRTVRAASAEAAQWQGWGTALKPAWEPIVLARKPIEGTVAANVLAHGAGALNIDGCRVGTDEVIVATRNVALGSSGSGVYGGENVPGVYEQKPGGRWPANILHDGSDEVVAAFPETSPAKAGKPRGAASGQGWGMTATGAEYDDAGGSAARFFYSAKADAQDRIGSKHPTVKPVDLMQWLCRLVTPPGGVVLDPFAGSGTTGEAAWREGFSAVLIEREATYREDIARRLTLALAGPATRKAEIAASKKQAPIGGLFAEAAE